MKTETRMICIFCGGKAEIKRWDGLEFVSCPRCNRETELHIYQDLFDEWLGDIQNEAQGP